MTKNQHYLKLTDYKSTMATQKKKKKNNISRS